MMNSILNLDTRQKISRVGKREVMDLILNLNTM